MKAETEGIEELDRLLDERLLSGLWRIPHAERPFDPKTDVKPHLWKWSDVHDSLIKAMERIGIHAAVNERRTIRLVNPALKTAGMTAHTMVAAFQLIQPGEVAPAHRHTMAAFRFILRGKGAYTAVEGERLWMSDGDLILTPSWTFHEHAHEGTEPVIWMDGLDVPLVRALNVISLDFYPDKAGLPKRDYDPGKHTGAPLQYRFEETYPRLKQLAQGEGNPYDGVVQEYLNPANGGPTLPTVSCWMQMLRPGESTKSHRHTSTSIYHVFRGSGTTVINGQPFHWEKGDSFIVPLWSWHEHANRSTTGEALLFSMHDKPVFDAFGLYREEGK